MLETPHVAVGIALAAKFPNPWVSIPLSLASHFILDKVPHWNPHLYTETQKLGHPSKKSTVFAIIDVGSAFVLGSYFALQTSNINQSLVILACSFASVASDVIKYPYYYFSTFRPKWLVSWVKFERSMQVDAKSPFWGILTQVLVTFAALYTLLF